MRRRIAGEGKIRRPADLRRITATSAIGLPGSSRNCWRCCGGCRARGAVIAAYGASAKGSTLMNAFGIDRSLIEFVVDRSSLKQGRFTPGNHLPILPTEALARASAGLRPAADLELCRGDSGPAERVPPARRQVHCPGSRGDGDVSVQRCSNPTPPQSLPPHFLSGLASDGADVAELQFQQRRRPLRNEAFGQPEYSQAAPSRNGNGK